MHKNLSLFNFFFLNSPKEKLTGFTSGTKIKPLSDGLGGLDIGLEAIIGRLKTKKYECHECDEPHDVVHQLRDHLMRNNMAGERFITLLPQPQILSLIVCEMSFSLKKD